MFKLLIITTVLHMDGVAVSTNVIPERYVTKESCNNAALAITKTTVLHGQQHSLEGDIYTQVVTASCVPIEGRE